MKTSTNEILTALAICSVFFFCSCKKDVENPGEDLPVSPDETSETDAPGLYKTPSGAFKLVLQPGDDIGQDAWIEFNPTNTDFAARNSGSIDQFRVMAWTDLGDFYAVRSVIRFNELSEIPSGSQVGEAKLFLYGLEESSIHMPEGNSYYPGSPYNSFGPNDIYVQKIISLWDENSVNWNNQPSTSSEGESIIQASNKQWEYNASVNVSNIVESFVKQPSNNYGFMLSLVDENIYHSMGFYSSESIDHSKRPKLIIIYTN